jgi:Flp pilus assembly protein TadD
LSALFEHVLSRIAAGDADAARTAARQAVAVSATVTGSESFEAMNELAAVLISSRDYMEAETLLRRAQVRATGVTAVRVANNLAAIAALRGDVGAAESMYRSALASAGKSPELESARGAIEKNLEALRSR